jgi:hypothetical protein
VQRIGPPEISPEAARCSKSLGKGAFERAAPATGTRLA